MLAIPANWITAALSENRIDVNKPYHMDRNVTNDIISMTKLILFYILHNIVHCGKRTVHFYEKPTKNVKIITTKFKHTSAFLYS